jgi:hypothetical protein
VDNPAGSWVEAVDVWFSLTADGNDIIDLIKT